MSQECEPGSTTGTPAVPLDATMLAARSKALLLAAASGDLKHTQFLLDSTPALPLDTRNDDGLTALDLACKARMPAIVGSLLSREGIQSTLTMKCEQGKTPLDHCIGSNLAPDEDLIEVVRLFATSTQVPKTLKQLAEFFLACLEADDEKKEAIVKKIDAGEMDDTHTASYRTTPLMLACMVQGNEIIIQALLARPQSKTEVNQTNHEGLTPLCIACQYDNAVAVKALLCRSEVNPFVHIESYRWSHGYTPLLVASHKGSTHAVRVLLNDPRFTAAEVMKTSTDRRDSSDGNALHVACKENQRDAVEILLQSNKIDPCAKNSHDRTPLLLTCSQKYADIFELLLSDPRITQADVDTVRTNKYLSFGRRNPADWPTDEVNKTMLHTACARNDEQIVTLLLNSGKADPCKTDCEARTPLMFACEKGHTNIARMLLDDDRYSEDALNTQGYNSKKTAFYLACENKHTDTVMLLLADKRTNLCTETRDGWTPLMIAYEKGLPVIFQAILADTRVTGVDVDKMIPSIKMTLLQRTYSNGDIDTFKALLNSGKVDPNKKDKDGYTPLMCALRDKKNAFAQAIIDCRHFIDANTQATGDGATALAIACSADDISMVRTLLDSKISDPNVANHAGVTPLMIACRQGNHAVVKALLEAGADPGKQDESDNTALHYACERNDIARIRSDLTLPQTTNKPIRIRATHSHSDMVATLLAHPSINPHTLNRHNQSPLDIACCNLQPSIIHTLLADSRFEPRRVNETIRKMKNEDAMNMARHAATMQALLASPKTRIKTPDLIVTPPKKASCHHTSLLYSVDLIAYLLLGCAQEVQPPQQLSALLYNVVDKREGHDALIYNRDDPFEVTDSHFIPTPGIEAAQKQAAYLLLSMGAINPGDYYSPGSHSARILDHAAERVEHENNLPEAFRLTPIERVVRETLSAELVYYFVMSHALMKTHSLSSDLLREITSYLLPEYLCHALSDSFAIKLLFRWLSVIWGSKYIKNITDPVKTDMNSAVRSGKGFKPFNEVVAYFQSDTSSKRLAATENPQSRAVLKIIRAHMHPSSVSTDVVVSTSDPAHSNARFFGAAGGASASASADSEPYVGAAAPAGSAGSTG